MRKSIKISQSITDRQDTSLGIYFKDVSRLSLLTPEEEKELGNKIKNGSKEARDRLVSGNLRFAISVAKQYQGKGMPLVDLIQAANCGLIEASNRFDPDKGIKFISFAVWWIRQAIVKSLLDLGKTVRMPMNQITTINKINKISSEFEQKYGRTPSVDEIEENTDLSIDKINSANCYTNTSVSLDTPFKSEDVNCLLDVIPNDNSDPTDLELVNNNKTTRIEEILNTLSPRNGDVIKMSFGIGMPSIPNERIANYFGIGSERVRQIIRDTLIRLRKTHSKELSELL